MKIGSRTKDCKKSYKGFKSGTKKLTVRAERRKNEREKNKDNDRKRSE